MADTEHKYEVSFDDKGAQGGEKKEKGKQEGDRQVEAGKVSVALPKGDDKLAASQDAVSSAYAEAIERAVINSSQDNEPQQREDSNASRVAELEKENALLRKETDSANASIAKEREEKVKLLKTIEENAGALEKKYTSQITHLQNALKEAEEQVTFVRAEAHHQEERVTQAEAQVRALQGQAQEQKQSGKAGVDQEEKVKEIKGVLSNTTRELEFEKNKAHEENLKHIQQIEALMNEISQHGTKLRAQEQRVIAELEAKNDVVSNLENVKAQLRVRDAECIVAQQDRAQLQARLGQTNVILAELKKQNADLLRQLEEERAKHAAATAAKLASTSTATASSSSAHSASPPPSAKLPSNWRPHPGWVPSVVFIGLSAVAAAKFLNR